jgi:predicted AAA+ superfamily ATPase
MPDYSKENPYSIIFGREPHMVINRDEEAKSIIKVFSQDIPSQQAYMITGIRGSGKTVFMSDISDYFSKQKDWICVELSADRDMLQSLAAKLTSDNALARLFKSADINLSLFGIGLTVAGVWTVYS